MASAHFDSIDAYIAAADPEVRHILQRIRTDVKILLPEATETISYGIPAFKTDRVFFYFAAFKHHIGIYPPLRNQESLRKEVQPYANAKGNLRFPLSEEIPYPLIVRVAAALANQHSDS